MAKIRILRKGEKAYIELPPEMSGSPELELFQLREGYYLLSVPLGQAAPHPQQTGGLNEREKAVLRKLLSIRFEKRTPAYVKEELTPEELEVLSGLEGKGLVNVFRGSKYKDGVYNIKDSIYPHLSGNEGEKARTPEPGSPERENAGPVPAAQRGGGPVAARAAPSAGYSDSFSLLTSRGYLIVLDKNEARSLSERLNTEMKSGAVLGVKGFDGKFYIVTRSYFNSALAAIGPIFKDEMDGPSIASAAKLDPEGCMAVLRLMAENGEIIEKKRGVFAPV